ncbi:MarR family winged helix-turn-helix transcriptional regulator [Micromonospora zhanjiangensis]|uniref:MarR family winged helix-turn-helix transcriptional regulator n=1 Tax=Micromonospora zhanjiangensis TaxID=1522057 RepID=A0ABV8KHT5_9ACTN
MGREPPSPAADLDLPPRLLGITTFLLSTVGRRARRRLGERLTGHGIRLWHVAVLSALADFGPANQRDLGRRLGIDPSDLVGVLDDLESAGRLSRRRDPADRRRYVVSVTPVGRAALDAATREADAVHDEVLAPLTPAERRQLHALLLRVLTRG